MAKGLSLDIGMNTREVVRGAADAEQALEGVADALDVVGREGEEGAEQIARSFSEAQRDVSRAARKMGDDVTTGTRRGFDRAKEGVREFRGEAVQNLGEVASSFDGTVQGIADGAQGLAGGAGVALLTLGGPAAVVGGALTALGIVGGAALASIAEDAEAAAERVSAAFDDMIESGQNFVSEEFLADAVKSIIDDDGQLERAQKWADQLQLPIETVVRALAGYGDAVSDVRERVDIENARIRESYGEMSRGAVPQITAAVAANEEILIAVTQAGNGYGDAARKADLYRAATQEQTASVDGLTASLNGVPGTVAARVELDTSAAARALKQLTQTPIKVPVKFFVPYGGKIG